MPSSIVTSFAEKSGKSVSAVEKLWDEIKSDVKKNYPDVSEDSDRFYKLVTGILKKRLKLENIEEDDDIEDPIGKLVDFGPYGKLYVAFSSGDNFWVTDEKPSDWKEYGDRHNVPGWYIKQRYAKKLVPDDEEGNETLKDLKESDEDPFGSPDWKLINKYIDKGMGILADYDYKISIDSVMDHLISKGADGMNHADWDEVETELRKAMTEEEDENINESTLSTDIAIKPEKMGIPQKRVVPDDYILGIPIFEVDSKDFMMASKMRQSGARYKITNEKFKQFIKENGYRNSVAVRWNGHLVRVK